MNGRVFFLAALLCTELTHADFGVEIKQQQEIEARLQSELKEEKKLSTKAYRDIFDFASQSSLNRDEQVRRLESANKIWDEFIKNTCRAEVLEAIGTRAEYASIVQCMIKRYKEKKTFFNSLI